MKWVLGIFGALSLFVIVATAILGFVDALGERRWYD